MMVIKEFKEEDYDVYCALSDKFYASGASLTTVPKENYKQTFEACVSRSPFLRGFLIEWDGKPVGYFLLTYTWYNEFCGETVTLDEIYVDEAHRGKGIGSKAIAWIAENHKDYKGIQLEVQKDNSKAMELYSRMGFELMDYYQMVLKPKEIYHHKK